MIDRDSKCWGSLPKAQEGHIGKYKNKVDFIERLVGDVEPIVSAQTGFNAGHSACIILEGCNTKLYSFDVGRHKDSTPIAVEVVDEYFPERHTYIEGDSKETLKEFNEQLDFAFVDGGHDKETCLSDIENFDRCLSAGGIMLVDDAHQSGVGNAIKSFDWEGYEELEVDNYEHKAKLYKKL